MDRQKKTVWLERVEDLINILKGSSISEMEFTEAGTEIIIRRQPGMVLMPGPIQPHGVMPLVASGISQAPYADLSVPVIAPLTGVYYAAASPTSPPFVHIGDIVPAGQVVALVEAMKVFNEIPVDITGRVVALNAHSGEVVQKGDVLLRIEPV